MLSHQTFLHLSFFTFCEEILYLDNEQSYPNSKEVPGYFLGVAKHSGDALTFNILTAHGTVLTRSVIRSASGKPLAGFPNKRTTHQAPMEVVSTSGPPYPDHTPSAVLHNGGVEIETESIQQGLFNKTQSESKAELQLKNKEKSCLLYTSPSPRDS